MYLDYSVATQAVETLVLSYQRSTSSVSVQQYGYEDHAAGARAVRLLALELGQTQPLYYYGVRGEFGWVRFLVVCFLYKPIPTHEKSFAVRKSGPNATFFSIIFLGLGCGLGLVSSSVS